MPQRNSQRVPVVLLIEDNPAQQVLTRRAFARGEVEVDMHVAADGEEAMRYLRGVQEGEGVSCAKPDLILLDLNLPRIDGRAVLRETKGDPALNMIPVVVLTTSVADSDVQGCYEAGCNAYVTKPQDIDEFALALRTLAAHWFDLVVLPTHEMRRQVQ